nr:hypothetical protein [Bacillus licheniformis]
MESVIAALFRYFSFVLDILKSPVRTALDYDRSYFKYSVISMTLLAVFFSLGNFYQAACGPGENSRVRRVGAVYGSVFGCVYLLHGFHVLDGGDELGCIEFYAQV